MCGIIDEGLVLFSAINISVLIGQMVVDFFTTRDFTQISQFVN